MPEEPATNALTADEKRHDDVLRSMIRGGRTPKDAYDTLRALLGDAPAKAALIRYEKAANHIRVLKDPISFSSPDTPTWYAGPAEGDKFWPALREHLLERKKWPISAVERIDQASTKILSLMQPPGLARVNTKGLVVGYVQSGKTANYSALIAKAADAGYRFVIVLAGIHNALRRQTQIRLQEELSDLNPRAWYTRTDVQSDFRAGAGNNTNAVLNDESHLRILCVVKKNAIVLRRLLKWLRSAHPDVLAACPVLVIDDEADQAGLNASRDEGVRTAINRELLRLFELLPKVAYVGYTATPFANVLIDPSGSDLYPSTFIASLPKPTGYFGAESLFGREPLTEDDTGRDLSGLDMIRLVPDEEIDNVRPASRAQRADYVFEMVPSLKRALDYFLLACAARRARGQNEHSSMLVHTTVFAGPHQVMAAGIDQHWKRRCAELRKGDPETLQALETLWNDEVDRARDPAWGCARHDFAELRPLLPDIAAEACILVENGESLQRLDYQGDPKVQIAVGGNTLSRGLTLEGLLVSYFVRTATAYDTLLQMGRWFGYRFGYQDLPRIWMTDELKESFAMLATVEEEIRHDIARYEREHLTPEMFGVRIRTHPTLAITSRLKMQHAVECGVSYSNTTTQTRFFKHDNQEWLAANTTAVRRLLTGLDAPRKEKRWFVFPDVPTSAVLEFLRDYRIHEAHDDITTEKVSQYIKAQNKAKSLLTWNIVLASRATPDDELGTLTLGPGLTVNLVNRSRLDTGSSYANTGTITTQEYITADLGGADRAKGDPGCLILVPISKDSRADRANRVGLNAADHIIGVALDFPEADKPTPAKYMTVDLSRIEREVEEEFRDDEEDVEEATP